MPYIKVIEPEEADGELKEIYQELERKRGELARIHKIQSLNPESITKHMDIYMSIMFGKSPLSRAQREMMGVAVSAENECKYCIKHHSEALNHYWKDRKKVKRLASDFTQTGLEEVDMRLCKLAKALTVNLQADAGWIGEAGPGPSYGDETKNGPAGFDNEFTQRNTTFMTWNLMHLARILKEAGDIPAHGNQRSEWEAGCRFDYANPEYR